MIWGNGTVILHRHTTNKIRGFRQVHDCIVSSKSNAKHPCPRLYFHPLYSRYFMAYGTMVGTGPFQPSHPSEAMPVVRLCRHYEG